MAVWGVVGGSSVDEKRLSRLGLICYGGGSNNKGMTYHVYSKDKTFNKELNKKDFDNIEVIYKKYLRKKKLQKINKL